MGDCSNSFSLCSTGSMEYSFWYYNHRLVVCPWKLPSLVLLNMTVPVCKWNEKLLYFRGEVGTNYFVIWPNKIRTFTLIKNTLQGVRSGTPANSLTALTYYFLPLVPHSLVLDAWLNQSILFGHLHTAC